MAKDVEGNDLKMPFNSTNKYAFSLRKVKTEDSDICLYTKGAPEKIWALCKYVYYNGEILEKNAEWE
jgi:sodium/potassium-transporting ATPase subunit alpha